MTPFDGMQDMEGVGRGAADFSLGNLLAAALYFIRLYSLA